MELALSLGNTGVVEGGGGGVNNNTSLGFCMGLGSSSSSPPSTSRLIVSSSSGKRTHHHQDDHHQDEKREKVGGCSSSSSDPSQPSLQLDLLPFSPVPRHTQPNPPNSLRFPWLADNLSSEPGSSDVNRRGVAGEEVDEGSSPNSGTSSFMEFSLYTNNNGGGGSNKFVGRRENGVELQHGVQELVGVGSDGVERTTSRGGGGNISDDDENGSTRKKLRLSKEQSAFLEESFKEHHTLNPKQKLALAKQLSLRPRQVEVWFQNRRARTKLKQTEVDCEYLKRCCETLTEENRRLQKELQELRALKTSQPFFMHLPATTLTMCPSCERVAPTSNSSAPAAKSSLSPATATPNANEMTLSLGKPMAALPFAHAPRPHQAAS